MQRGPDDVHVDILGTGISGDAYGRIVRDAVCQASDPFGEMSRLAKLPGGDTGAPCRRESRTSSGGGLPDDPLSAGQTVVVWCRTSWLAPTSHLLARTFVRIDGQLLAGWDGRVAPLSSESKTTVPSAIQRLALPQEVNISRGGLKPLGAAAEVER